MKLNTASEAISLARKLESDSAGFYQGLSQQYNRDGDLFHALTTENEKNIVQIERAYYGVISDAIEGCFAFNIEEADYILSTELTENMSYAAALDKAVKMEEKIIKYYSDAAEQSKSLMADVPRTFKMIAKKRGQRLTRLAALIP